LSNTYQHYEWTMCSLSPFVTFLRGAADKSLGPPSSRCRRKESIVSFEKEACSCAELQVFLCYRGRKEHIKRCMRFQQHRDASCHRFFFFLQAKAPKEIHAILTETLREYSLLYATVKNWVAQFKRGDFSTCDAPRPGRPKTVTIVEIIDQIRELILEDAGFRLNQKLGKWASHVSGLGPSFMKIWTCGKCPKIFRVQKSAEKFLTSIFWDQDGIFLIDYLPNGQTINAEYYSSLLVQLKGILKKKRRKVGRSSRGSCSCTTMCWHSGNWQARETGLPGLPVS